MPQLPVIDESLQQLERRLRRSESPEDRTKLRILLRIKQGGISDEEDLAAVSGLDSSLLSGWLRRYESGGLERMLASEGPGEPDDSLRPPVDWDHRVEGIRLFKSNHYVGNYLELADLLLDIIFDLLPGTQFTLRSGRTVSEAFSLTELSILQSLGSSLWSDPEGLPDLLADPAQVPELTPFWGLIYDLVFQSTGDFSESSLTVNAVKLQVDATVQEAGGQELYPAFFELQLKVAQVLLARLGSGLSFDDVLLILRGFQTIRELLDEILPYSFDKLFMEFPLSRYKDEDGWHLRLDGVFEVRIPEDPRRFFSWSFDSRLFLTLRLEEVVLADESEIALFNPNKKGGEMRFPLGGSVGDIMLSGINVQVRTGGQLSDPVSRELGPYHRFQEVYFLNRDGENLLRHSLDVDDVRVTLNTTVLTTFLFFLNLLNFMTPEQMREMLGDTIRAWLGTIDDFGEIGEELSNALEAVVPGALAIQQQNYYLPYTSTLTPYAFEYLETGAEGKALTIENSLPRGPGPDYEIEPVYPDRPSDLGPGILDWEDPLPSSQPTPTRLSDLLALPGKTLNGLRLTDEGRSKLRKRQEQPEFAQEMPLAGHLLSEGMSLGSITWLNRGQIDLEKRKVLGQTISQRTAEAIERHLKRLQEGPRHGRRTPFLFAGRNRLPGPKAVLLEALPYLGDAEEAGDASTGEPRHPLGTPSESCSFDETSTLKSRQGTAIDPAWLGLSVNCVVVDQALDVLLDSGAFFRDGEITFGESNYEYRTSVFALSQRLTAKLKSRDGIPTATAHNLLAELSGETGKVRYRVNLTVPIYPVKAAVGCLPDTAVDEVFFYRSCILAMTGGSIPDSVYIDELLYRHFVFLELGSTGISVEVSEMLEGEGTLLAELVSRNQFLVRLFETILPEIYKVPLVFDPYYLLNPQIVDFEGKGGWLNVYETYSLEV